MCYDWKREFADPTERNVGLSAGCGRGTTWVSCYVVQITEGEMGWG